MIAKCVCSMTLLPTFSVFPALPAGNAVERGARGRAQIEKLMWQYVRALDTENADAYAAIYAPDGRFGSGPTAVKGRDALKKTIGDFKQRAANEAKTGEKRPATCQSSPTATLNSPIRTTRVSKPTG